MLFVVFAAAALAWSLFVLRASVRRGGRRALLAVSAIAVAASIASIANDARALRLARTAERSTLSIRITPRDGWWQLDYDEGGLAVTSANELHVPIGTAVSLTWSALPPPSIANAVCAPHDEVRCTLVAGADAREARFVRLWRPMWRTLPVVAVPRVQFERWLRNEAQPARPSDGAALFDSAGCSFCHVVRGAVEQPSQAAPDLTHFASRRTIAATELPNRRGFLEGWIVHSAALKPGSTMPDNRVDPRVLHALAAYLESLR